MRLEQEKRLIERGCPFRSCGDPDDPGKLGKRRELMMETMSRLSSWLFKIGTWLRKKLQRKHPRIKVTVEYFDP